MNRRIVILAGLLLVALTVLWLVQDPEPIVRTPSLAGADADLDVAYGPDERNRLDVYTPADGVGPYPTVIWMHPGGWTAGDKAMSMPVWEWTDRGYAIVSVNYRYAVAPNTVADSVADALAAVRHVIDNHDNWDLDPDRTGVYGFSAGGHLAAMVAHEDLPVHAVAISGAPTDFGPLLDSDATFFDGKRGAAVVKAARELLGCTDDPPSCDGLGAAVSPAQLSAGAVDLLIVHGARDPIVDVDQAVRLHDHLVAEGTAPELVIIEGGGHDPFAELGGIDDFFDDRLLS